MSDSENAQIDSPKKYPRIGQRHFQALLMFLGMIFVFALRTNISAAIVPLTQGDDNENSKAPTYDWDPSTKSLVLSSFFWGYVIGQVPCGLLAQRFGGKIVLVVGTTIAGVITLVHPIAITTGGWQALVTLRVISGISQAVLYPSLHTIMVKWVPRTERGFLATVVYSGGQLGVTIILGTSGKIFESMGWPGIFYISGGVALAWALLFLLFASDDPGHSKYISKAELEYIESFTGMSSVATEKLPVPWKAMLTSLPFLALIAAQCAFTWGFYTLLTQIPIYLNNVLQLDFNSNALLAALPYFVMWLLGFVISPISDWLVNRNIVTVTVARKIFNSIGEWIPMICLIALGYVTQDTTTLAIALLTVAVGLNASTYCGYLVNHMDLAPNFAGVMLSISNGVAAIASIVAPLAVGAIVKNEEDPTEWRIVFFIAAGIYLVCNSLFVIFGKATLQPWNEPSFSAKKQSGVESKVSDTKSA